MATQADPIVPAVVATSIVSKDYNFAEFLESGTFADFTLVVGERRFLVHRLVLASKCDFFGVMLHGGWSEIAHNEMVFNFADPLNAFPDVLRFLYTNRIEVTVDNIPGIAALAEQLQIRALQKIIAEKIKTMITPDNAFYMMQGALQYAESAHIVDTCCVVLAESYTRLEDLVLDLPYEFYLRVIELPQLVVQSEMWLVESIVRYVNRKIQDDDALSGEQIQGLLKAVQFCHLSSAHVKAAQEIPIVNQHAQDALLDGLCQRLLAVEGVAKLPAKHRVSIPVVPSSSFGYKWARSPIGKNVKVSKDGTVITKKGDNPEIARTESPLPRTGCYQWRVQFKPPTQGKGAGLGSCYYIGVLTKPGTIHYSDSMCEDPHNAKYCWGLHDSGGGMTKSDKKHAGKTSPYGQRWGSRDKIDVRVDMDARTLAFYKNGKYLGIAYKDLPDEIYPAVTIYNDKVTCVISEKAFDAKKTS
eukprot:TRINITY_DN14189_c0_g1_i1.p1 TRINITY_DN14189_c0_g1~~TRINITY_DN14189_c0_g1_i1.p1  ORF type:complete len:486 (+),score=63.13 TRINITY_DN14189_c0_g1_i1:46-1458(+)